MAITFQSQLKDFDLKNKTAYRKWINKVIEKEKKNPGQINYLFTSDAGIIKINYQYLKHNSYTDIITFDYCEDEKINGDILISIDRVKDNAIKLNLNLDDELKRVIIHGVLHLLGYKDKTELDKIKMRKKEELSISYF